MLVNGLDTDIRLAITTCTYNRCSLLERLYNSLLAQTSKKFVWYIVDNGSQDGTWTYLQKISSDEKRNGFKIVLKRLSQNNYSRAVNYLRCIPSEEFSLAIDDDDVPLPKMVDSAYDLISKMPKDNPFNKFAGIAGLYLDINYNPMFEWPGNKKWIDATNLQRRKYGLTGDKCEIYKTEINRLSLYPEPSGEFFYDSDYCFNEIANMGYKIRWTNVPLCRREYLAEGFTKNYQATCVKYPITTVISVKKNFSLKGFPVGYYVLGRYYYNMHKLKSNNNITQCATNIGVSRRSIIIGILVYKFSRIVIKHI